MENKHNFMETESITKLLIKFSVPAIVGMFVNALYNVVDRIYIGNIKDKGEFACKNLLNEEDIRINYILDNNLVLTYCKKY